MSRLNIQKTKSQYPIDFSIKKYNLITDICSNYTIYLFMILPMVLFFAIFSYIPILGNIIAFQDYDPNKVFLSDFVGLKNFEFFFTSLDWFRVSINTIYLNILFIVSGTVFPIILAIMFSEITKKKFVRITQSVAILPHFISWGVVSMFIISIFSSDGGLLNNILVSFGKQPINFNNNPDIWPPLLVLMRLWKEGGFSAVIYIATIAGFDQEIYESAKIDGASRFQSIMKITVPQLRKTVLLLTLMAIGRIFYGDFGMIYAIVGDNSLLYSSTDVIDTFVFRALRMQGDFGMSAAVGLYQSLLGFLIVMAANKIINKIDNEAALF